MLFQVSIASIACKLICCGMGMEAGEGGGPGTCMIESVKGWELGAQGWRGGWGEREREREMT